MSKELIELLREARSYVSVAAMEGHKPAADLVDRMAEALAQPAQAVPTGWKLVPIKATPEMIKAGGHINSEWLNDSAPLGEARYGGPVVEGVYAAMLAAAPEAKP